MKTRSSAPAPPGQGHAGLPGVARAFTLIELLVVVAIIGLLAASSLPALRGLTQANTIAAAHRQALDVLAVARQSAISERQTVYVVFVPPSMRDHFARVSRDATLRPSEKQQVLRALTNLVNKQYTGYARFSRRTVGDQPGEGQPKYFKDGWHSLPDGVLFGTNKFLDLPAGLWVRETNALTRPLPYGWFRFPVPHAPEMRLPYIAFDSAGRLSFEDEVRAALNRLRLATPNFEQVLPLVRGSVFYPRAATGDYALNTPPDVVLTAKTNTLVRVNWLSGRARVEGLELTK